MFHQRYDVFSSRAKNVAGIRNCETSGIGETVSQTLNDAFQSIPMQDEVTVSIVRSELDELPTLCQQPKQLAFDLVGTDDAIQIGRSQPGFEKRMLELSRERPLAFGETGQRVEAREAH